MPISFRSPLLLLCCIAVACDEEPSGEPAPSRTPAEASSQVSPGTVPTPAEPRKLPQGQGLSPQEVEAKCKSICEKTSALPCVKEDACVAGCLESFALPACRGEFGKMLTCTEETPESGFVCDGAPTPVLKEGLCEAEQETAARCLEGIMRAQQGTQP